MSDKIGNEEVRSETTQQKKFDPKDFEKEYRERITHAEDTERISEGEPEQEIQEVEIDPEGFARSVGTLIAGFTGQDEEFVESYSNIAGLLLKVTGANKVQSFEMAYSKMPFILKTLIFGAIMGVPAIALIIVNKKMKDAKEKESIDRDLIQKEMNEKKFPPETTPVDEVVKSGVDRYASDERVKTKPTTKLEEPEDDELVTEYSARG